MECNKEEAIRAKDIAENKMKNNDFIGARKFALKAQQLYRDLENISQMITVCDVHCAAEKKLLGNEMDWYGILQIEQTADEATIKKQYRKFALQLHPDKNKFPGAETAFKVIGEAQRVLLDQGKRSMHDMKRKTSMSRPAAPYRPPQKSAWFSNVGIQNNIRSNFSSLNAGHQKPQHPVPPANFSGMQTFWTMCPFCTVRYQYYRSVINKTIVCQTCTKTFVAYERGEQGVPIPTNVYPSAFCPQKEVPIQGTCKVEQVFKGNFTADSSKTEFSQKKGCPPEVADKEKVNGKRGRKQVVESSASCDSDSSSDSEVDVTMDENGNFQGGQNSGCHRNEHLRRSSRSKQHVSYKENLSDDDDFVSHRKRAKGGGSSDATQEESQNGLKEEASIMNKQSGSDAAVEEEKKANKMSACSEKSLGNEETGKVSGKEKVEDEGCQKTSGTHADESKKSFEAINDSTSDSSSESGLDPDLYVYPDPDFNDFDHDRKEECFMVDQIWAVYDTLDAMPRFYARIRKVFPSGFRLRITWLEPDPDDENEIEWVNNGLPVSCGKFKLGNSENTEDRLMFSHLVSWEKGSLRDAYKVFPRKGETWGLFKDWDFKWRSVADTKRKYEFEFVEILSDYVEGVGICVSPLVKVKGFASVFCRKFKEGTDSFQIPAGELFRFSHRVPSFTLTGKEREGVPKGSFELDPASLPLNLEEIAIPEILKTEAGVTYSNCSLGSSNEEKPVMGSEEHSSMHQAEVKETYVEPKPEDCKSVDDIEHHSAPPDSIPEAIEIPDPEFFNFDAEKSEDKLRVGQIWSLYSDEDGLPKYYGEIVKVESNPVFKFHLRWLVSSSLPNNSIRWHDKDMPICCGRFKIRKGAIQKYYSTSSLSHQVRTESVSKKEFTIFPKEGEVWALYKNWTAALKCSDLENCEYDIVEICKANELQIEVLFLERVDGFKSVFRPQVKAAEPVLTKISLIELLRFSHQIPVFKLTNERGGSLRGFWELDPAALPVHYFLS